MKKILNEIYSNPNTQRDQNTKTNSLSSSAHSFMKSLIIHIH